MDGQNAVVNEGAETAPEVSTPSEEVPTSENQTEVEASAPVEEEQALPFGKHPRWQKMLSNNKELKGKISEYEQKLRAFEGFNDQEITSFRAIKQWLSQDPRNVEAFTQLFRGKAGQANSATQETPKDPYDGWDPEVAERFRKVDELEKWKAEFEQREQVREKTENSKAVDSVFVSKLKDGGYLDAEGNYKNQKLGDVIESATLTTMYRIAANPQRPTPEEASKAFDMVVSGLEAAEKNGIKKIAGSSVVPPTGSKTGAVPSGKKALKTDADIATYLANSLGG